MVISKWFLVPSLCAAIAFGTGSGALAAKKTVDGAAKHAVAGKSGLKPAAKHVKAKKSKKGLAAMSRKITLRPASKSTKHNLKKHGNKVTFKHA